MADGCTKPLSGQAFFRFIEDLGLKRGVNGGGDESNGPSANTSNTSHQRGAAMATLMTGSLLLSGLDSAKEEGDASSDAWWACGAMLMALGAIYVGQLAYGGMKCCLKRLRAQPHQELDNHWILCEESESGGESLGITWYNIMIGLAR